MIHLLNVVARLSTGKNVGVSSIFIVNHSLIFVDMMIVVMTNDSKKKKKK